MRKDDQHDNATSSTLGNCLIPKSETRADAFVHATGYAGQGIVIGILDTGIDPATHLYQPSQGKSGDGSNTSPLQPKLLDVVDCTGSGDVDVSTERSLTPPPSQPSVDAATFDATDTPSSGCCWTVQGLSGRTLQIPVHLWKIQPFPVLPTTATTPIDASTDQTDSKDADAVVDAAADNSQTDSATAAAAAAPTPSVRLGLKRAYDLFPQSLVQRLKQHRKKSSSALSVECSRHISQLRQQLAEWQTVYSDSNKPTAENVLQRDDWQALLDILQEQQTGDGEPNDDPGPLYDCVVYWDGATYRAAIDVNETGDLTSTQPLAAFGMERRHGTFGTVDSLNFAVQFYRNGTLLSIVTDCSPHGTHVASICADASDGVAPYAQLVSFKIGDPRLGTMETTAALARAMQLAASKYKCHVINLSYGEATQVPNCGRLVQHAQDLVWKHNVLFVAATGNQGPALSSVNAPGGTTSACIGVGAYVSPKMRRTLYSSLPTIAAAASTRTETETNEAASTNWSPTDAPVDKIDSAPSSLENTNIPETTYTWSSTGPTTDGDWGVHVVAPGGAIATVPHWCLSKRRLMNGTSMASPHVTGCVALLLSACVANGIPISSPRIQRALKNTARIVPNVSPLQQGFGMLQVDAAWDYLKAHANDMAEDVHFDVQVMAPGSGNGPQRGIYLRQWHESSVRQCFAVRIDPQFPRQDTPSAETQQGKIDFAMTFRLECTAEASSWVTFPANLVLMANEGRTFDIEVDPTRLAPGVHTTHVYGIDVNQPDRKNLFSVPITIIKPIMPLDRPQPQPIVDLGTLDFDDSEVKRFFVVPPPGSTWMDVTLHDTRDNNATTIADTDGTIDIANRIVALHTVQLLPHAAFRDNECNKRLALSPGQVSISSIAVESSVTCEIALARYWSTRGPTQLSASVRFRGVRPSVSDVQLGAGGSGGTAVRLYSDVDNEVVNPSAKVTKWLVPLRPKADAVIAPILDDRDAFCFNGKQIYQLILTYEFEQEEKGSFVPRAPALQGVLYESGLESQCMMIFDGHKKYLGFSDTYPSTVHTPKGSVVVRLQLRHDDPTKLEKLKDLVVWIERNLAKDIPLSTYATKEALLLEQDTFTKRTIRKGSSAVVFFAGPGASKLPSGCNSGHKLIGTVTYEGGDAALPGAGKRPGGFPISYLVAPKPGKENTIDPAAAEPTTKPTVEQKLDDAVRDLKVEHLGKLIACEIEDGQFDKLYSKLETEYLDHLPLRMAKLKYLDGHAKRSDMLMEVIAAAKEVVSRVDEDELALNLGRKVDTEDGDAVKLREEVKEKKNVLIESLVRMALAYNEAKDGSNFGDTMKRLKAWVDIESSATSNGTNKYSTLYIAKHVDAGHYGLALKQINKLLAKDTKDKDTTIRPLTRSQLLEKRASLYDLLGFTQLAENESKRRVLACPSDYAPF